MALTLLRIANPTPVRRWITFYSVGALGIGVQLGAMALLTVGWGLHYLAATALAVEAAILHNFAWHEKWTWADRAAGNPAGRWRRLVRFHLANGAISIAGNLVLMQVLVGSFDLNYIVANVIAIAVCSLANFAAGDHLVFRG
jgi:putative flippase GtrA